MEDAIIMMKIKINMNRVSPITITLAILAACGVAQSVRAADEPNTQPAPAQSFAQAVDLTALGAVAVHSQGRVKSLDSFTRSAMQLVSGSRNLDNQSTTFTYFDMMFRPDAYKGRDSIFFKNKLMRADIIKALRQANPPIADFDAAREERFMTSGLLSAELVNRPEVQDLLENRSANMLLTAKLVEAIHAALNVMNPNALRFGLALVPPQPRADSGGGFDEPWMSLDELEMRPDIPQVDTAQREQLLKHWRALHEAWTKQDAPAVNAAANQLAAILPTINPEIYPEAKRLQWENWYFRSYNMTWVWIFYALAMIPLLLSIVFRWKPAYWLGLVMFLGALGVHTFAVGLRWYVSQRWPNSNMFEAITTAAWMGGCIALLIEILFARRSPMRGLFALGSCVASMTAMMAVKMFPIELNANISNMMPVLNDLWLYIHTNVIILSYCLIFIAAVTAGIYLIYRAVLLARGADGVNEYARVGGAGSLILTKPDGTSYLDEAKSTFGQVLDGTTMVVMELSFILLWAGIVMGAIWADHSWGRPWGWDPKEVFALNTFLVFLVLVHGRLKVKDKGLWTAALALIGAGVMLFNWIIINFAISGLHSYA
jgi:cytochrome c-type biogenesis protein CcsB